MPKTALLANITSGSTPSLRVVFFFAQYLACATWRLWRRLLRRYYAVIVCVLCMCFCILKSLLSPINLNEQENTWVFWFMASWTHFIVHHHYFVLPKFVALHHQTGSWSLNFSSIGCLLSQWWAAGQKWRIQQKHIEICNNKIRRDNARSSIDYSGASCYRWFFGRCPKASARVTPRYRQWKCHVTIRIIVDHEDMKKYSECSHRNVYTDQP